MFTSSRRLLTTCSHSHYHSDEHTYYNDHHHRNKLPIAWPPLRQHYHHSNTTNVSAGLARLLGQMPAFDIQKDNIQSPSAADS